jgi:predicted lipid-binding transport protein (Tim44 family)
MGYISYQAEKAATKGVVGLLVYGIILMLIVAAVVAVAGLIAVALAAMLLVSLLSVSVALWRRHVLHQPGSVGQLRPAGTKPTQWGDKGKRQDRLPRATATPALPAATAPAGETVPDVMDAEACDAGVDRVERPGDVAYRARHLLVRAAEAQLDRQRHR